ncbi:MAG: hypothetical protein OHK0029_21290 [Armatimonadaceae bacterium]
MVCLMLAHCTVAYAQQVTRHAPLPGNSPVWEQAAHWVMQPWVTIALLVFGCLCLFHEMLTPKTWGVSGNTGALCVGTVFAANLTLGEAGWTGVLLLLAGLAFVLLEVHVFPGTASAVGGFILMYAGMFQALGGVANAAFALPITTLLLMVSMLAFLTYLPKSPAWKQVSRKLHDQQVLSAATASGGSGRDPMEAMEAQREIRRWIGQTGITLTPLRPTGVVTFAEGRRRVVTEGEFLEAGTRVVVRQVEGDRIVVDPVSDEKAGPFPHRPFSHPLPNSDETPLAGTPR